MDHKDYRLAAIMFTDIVGFSRMMEKDEVGTLKLMEIHNSLVRSQIEGLGGKIIKTIGDAFLAEFPNVNNAVRCAVNIQKDLENFNASFPPSPLVLRIGVHLGDIHFFENDALGEGINIASRLQSQCTPGKICISQDVYNLVSNKIELPIRSLGQVPLKNISREIHAYEILSNGKADSADVYAAELQSVQSSKTREEDGSGDNKKKQEEKDQTSSIKDTNDENSFSASKKDAHFDSFKTKVLQQIKKAGRRLSIKEVRELLGPFTKDEEFFVERLAETGFLVRVRTTAQEKASPVSVSFEDNEDDSGNSDVFRSRGRRQRDREEIESPRHFFENIRTRHDGIFQEIKKEIKSEFKGIKTEFAQRVKNQYEYGTFSRNAPVFKEYIEKLDRRFRQEKSGFKSHLTSFLGVNAGLWVIWLATGAAFPWPFIVTTAWGIGMVTHWGAYRDSKRELAQLKALPDLEEKPFALVRKLFKQRKAWNNHLLSNLATSVFLLGLNLLVSPFVLWSIFPIAGMAIGLFAHLPAFKNKEQELLGQISAEGIPIDVLTNPATLKELHDQRLVQGVGPLGAEAEAIRLRILRQLKSFRGKHPLGNDFLSILDDYVKQIKELTLKDREIDLIIRGIPINDLDSELAKLAGEAGKTDNPRIRSEYDKSIEQLQKQKRAYLEMNSEQKVMKLRLQNALNSLKQLEIDLARMKSLASTVEDGNLSGTEAIKSKSSELQQYLSDLKAGYQEIDKLDKEAGLDEAFDELLRKAKKDENGESSNV